MAENKRTPTQRAVDLSLIEKWHLQGKGEHEIVAMLSGERSYTLSRQQINYDLHSLERLWLAEAHAEIDAHKAKVLAELRQLQMTYWEAWQDSKRPKEITSTEKGTRGKDSTARASIRKEERDGNPAYLAGVMTCIDRRCKILGLDAPLKIDIEQVIRQDAEALGLDPDDAVREAMGILHASRS